MATISFAAGGVAALVIDWPPTEDNVEEDWLTVEVDGEFAFGIDACDDPHLGYWDEDGAWHELRRLSEMGES